MHRDTNKWSQHLANSCSPTFPFSLSLPLTVSIIISLSHLGLLLPLSLITPNAPVSSSLFNAYQGFISVQVLLQAQGFRWVSRCLATAPLSWQRQSGQLWEMSYDKPTLLASPRAAPSIQPDSIWSPTRRQHSSCPLCFARLFRL